jgi:hypothetical protein
VERMRGRGINPTTSRQMRDDRTCSKSNGDGDGDRKWCTPPSRDLAATALVLAAEATAVLIGDDADGGNSGVAIAGSATLAAGGRVIN